MLLEERDFLLVLAEHTLHRGSQVVDVLQGLITNHQDFLGTIITSNHQEGRGGIINVINGLIQLRVSHLSLQQDWIKSCRSHYFTGIKLVSQVAFCLSHS